MFTTPEKVLEATGKMVTPDQVYKAQLVIEIYTGRGEADIKSGRDRGILERAVIMQTVYQMNNYDQVYEQVAAASISNNGTLVQFASGDDAAPFIAPLAVLACKHLSWFKSRGVSTGRTLQNYRESFRENWIRD